MTVAADAPPAVDPSVPGLYFKPNSRAQARFMASDSPELLVSSAYGKGKTRVLCEKAWWLCIANPGAEVVLARKQRAHMGATTLRTLLSEVVHESYVSYGWRPSADGGSTLFVPNGSKLLIVGLDNPGRARSGQFTAAFVDQAEELDEEEWNAIAGRLRHPVGAYRQLGAACNPESPDHFLYKRFRPDLGTHIQRTEDDEFLPNGRVVPAGRIVTEVILSGAHDNYANLPHDYMLRLARMKGRYYQRYVLGLWVAFEGMVYDVWEPDVHLSTRPASWKKWGTYPPPDWPRYRGIDFGYRNPFVCQWWAKSPDGVFWLYRELYHTSRTVQVHAKQIRECEDRELRALREGIDRMNSTPGGGSYEQLTEFPLTASISDHDAEDRATLDAEGVWTTPADKDVTPGIQFVYEMMQPTDIANVRSSRIVICRDALVERDHGLEASNLPLCTADEVGAYRYERTREGLEKSPKEQPRKMNDHGCDAMRYVLYTARGYGGAGLIVI